MPTRFRQSASTACFCVYQQQTRTEFRVQQAQLLFTSAREQIFYSKPFCACCCVVHSQTVVQFSRVQQTPASSLWFQSLPSAEGHGVRWALDEPPSPTAVTMRPHSRLETARYTCKPPVHVLCEIGLSEFVSIITVQALAGGCSLPRQQQGIAHYHSCRSEGGPAFVHERTVLLVFCRRRA